MNGGMSPAPRPSPQAQPHEANTSLRARAGQPATTTPGEAATHP